MNTILVQAQKDHIASLCLGSPIQALSELIWNALDADAFDVKIDLIQNALGGIDAIRISDDGLGIPLEEAESSFGNLGGSWKRSAAQTRLSARVIHGRKGKGRFKAFSLGNHVEWRTTVNTDTGYRSYRLSGEAAQPDRFEWEETSPGPATGTEVMITGIVKEPSTLLNTEWVVQQLASQFALYLKAYPNVRIYFQGLLVNPVIVQHATTAYKLKATTGHVAELQVIEWKTRQGRGKIVFCNQDGFALHEIDAGVRPGSGFNYTAYLISPRFKELQEENVLTLEEMHPEIKAFIDATRDVLRTHFTDRRKLQVEELTQLWKQQQVYPYRAEPASEQETRIRKRFDACAQAIRAGSKAFDQFDPSDKRLILGLLKEVVEQNPDAAIGKIADLLGLPVRIRKQMDKAANSQ
ncbi:MAG: ATP-binding protein [Kiritimatiellae bacterium]|nr:ATP-binding protein [Kiritimatiellia bacterium]